MKQGLKPTRRQRGVMEQAGLDAREWLVVKDTPEGLVIVNKESGEVKEIHFNIRR